MKKKTFLILLTLLVVVSCKNRANQTIQHGLQQGTFDIPESNFSRLRASPERAHLSIVFRDENGNPFLRGKITLTTPEDFQFALLAGNTDSVSAWLPYDRYKISMDDDIFSVYDYEIEGLKDPEVNKLSFEAVGEIRLIITFIRKEPKPLPTI